MKRFNGIAFSVILSTTALQASIVVPNGPWQTLTTPPTITGEVITSSVNNAGNSSAYWNNGTQDSANCANIGCFITKSSYFASEGWSPNLTDPVWLGQNVTGAAVPDFYFSANSTDQSTTILAEVAGLAASNWLGWYQQGAILTAANKGTAWDVIFTGSNQVSDTASFTPTQNFGLWFLSNFTSGSATDAQIVAGLGSNGQFMESSRNAASRGTTNQYFTAFARSALAADTIPADFWIGIEDVILPSSDRDYNDMVVNLRVVPEPGYYLLLSVGLLGLGVAHRWLKRGASRQVL